MVLKLSLTGLPLPLHHLFPSRMLPVCGEPMMMEKVAAQAERAQLRKGSNDTSRWGESLL
jgi:hypothetical protein